jgi:hypothetical protein
LALAQAIQHKDFSDLDKLLLNIKTDVFSDSDPLTVEEAEGDLAAMESELSVLLSADDSDITSVTAVRSGIFSSAVDGFESVGPDDLDHLTPETYRTLFEAPGAIPGDALGKLITGITWYFTAVMDESDAEKLAGMKRPDSFLRRTTAPTSPWVLRALAALRRTALVSLSFPVPAHCRTSQHSGS